MQKKTLIIQSCSKPSFIKSQVAYPLTLWFLFKSPYDIQIFNQLRQAKRIKVMSNIDELFRAVSNNTDKYVVFIGEDLMRREARKCADLILSVKRITYRRLLLISVEESKTSEPLILGNFFKISFYVFILFSSSFFLLPGLWNRSSLEFLTLQRDAIWILTIEDPQWKYRTAQQSI